MMPESSKSSRIPTSKKITQEHESFELIFYMLMGIRTAVGRFTSAVLPEEMGPAEFNQNWEGDFLARGTPETPAHNHSDFRFKDYSPLVFRQLRERFGITSQDYMLSLTSEYVLVEMSTNSKSGSFFFYSADYRFVLKTCTKREAAFLMAALPPYHQHLMAHRFTLLCRFFGLHRVQHRSGKMVYFVVMGNVFPIDKPIHERYDLKGSTRNRFTTDAERADPNVVLKDLDFINARRKLLLGEDKKRRLLAQIKKDCELLERLEVTDYSLLIGIHRAASKSRKVSRGKCIFYKVGPGGGGSCATESFSLAPANDKSLDGANAGLSGVHRIGGSCNTGNRSMGGSLSTQSQPETNECGMSVCGSSCADDKAFTNGGLQDSLREASSVRREVSHPHEGADPRNPREAPIIDDWEGSRTNRLDDGPGVRIVDAISHEQLASENGVAYSAPQGQAEGCSNTDVSSETHSSRIGSLPATCEEENAPNGANSAATRDQCMGAQSHTMADINKEIYYVGVIDILCEYGFKKQIEHSYKAAKYGEKVGAQNFSVVDPSQYSQRFQNFIEASIA